NIYFLKKNTSFYLVFSIYYSIIKALYEYQEGIYLKKKNRDLRGIGTTMLAGSIALGSFTSVNLPNPIAVEAAIYQDVVLKQGMRHHDVVQLKKDLAKVGFKVPGKGTTLFGAQTEEQVKAFQNYYGLTADGIVGKQAK